MAQSDIGSALSCRGRGSGSTGGVSPSCGMGPTTKPAPILRGLPVTAPVASKGASLADSSDSSQGLWCRCGPGDTGTGVQAPAPLRAAREWRLRCRVTGTRAQGPRAARHDGTGQLELKVRVCGRATTARGRARPGQGACHRQTHHFKVPASAPGLRPPGGELGRGPALRCERAPRAKFLSNRAPLLWSSGLGCWARRFRRPKVCFGHGFPSRGSSRHRRAHPAAPESEPESRTHRAQAQLKP